LVEGVEQSPDKLGIYARCLKKQRKENEGIRRGREKERRKKRDRGKKKQ